MTRQVLGEVEGRATKRAEADLESDPFGQRNRERLHILVLEALFVEHVLNFLLPFTSPDVTVVICQQKIKERERTPQLRWYI